MIFRGGPGFRPRRPTARTCPPRLRQTRRQPNFTGVRGRSGFTPHHGPAAAPHPSPVRANERHVEAGFLTPMCGHGPWIFFPCVQGLWGALEPSPAPGPLEESRRQGFGGDFHMGHFQPGRIAKHTLDPVAILKGQAPPLRPTVGRPQHGVCHFADGCGTGLVPGPSEAGHQRSQTRKHPRFHAAKFDRKLRKFGPSCCGLSTQFPTPHGAGGEPVGSGWGRHPGPLRPNDARWSTEGDP